ncbi:Pleckstrin like proteiny domain-containing family G member 3 [Chelonia mydas]|uniref:Pleckstrin like proteiny domain-containing family G member 3 n=1 Tax=Chelonia mydas TaxID=8469 RepID=M7ASP4_CHEMY|nr:Pleckstrin like proteiny domain-containing family G member 3 [Chelonia mydas]
MGKEEEQALGQGSLGGLAGKGTKGSQEPGSPENCHSAETTSAILEVTRTPKPALLAQQREMEQERSLAMAENTEDLKPLSSEEEAEEEEEEEARARSILPPSVLDHASLIAEMFTSSFSRRSSLALEEGRPGGFLTPRLPPPRVPPLSEAELSECLKNKVYQLARQYSLRIRSRQPAGHRRFAELEELRSCAAPPPRDGHQEVKRNTGPRKPALSLAAFEQVVLPEYSPRTPLSAATSSQDKSPKHFSFSPSYPTSPGTGTLPGPSSCSPLSPIVVETFPWPDVRELRSRSLCNDYKLPR